MRLSPPYRPNWQIIQTPFTALTKMQLTKRFILTFLAALIVLSVTAISVIVPPSSALTNSGSILTLGTPLTEDFNTLATSGTANAWADNSTIGGLYAQFSAVPTNPTVYIADPGTSNTGGIHSYGTTGERAFGSVGSNATGDIFYGFKLTNNTGTAITSLDISYTGEQWRNGGNTTAQQLDFQYQVANSGTITDINTPGTGWIDFNSLDFVSPVTGATAAALDGNLAANRTSKSGTITVSVSPGQEVWLRWKDTNDAGNDHGLAVDDFSVTANGGGGVNLSINDVTVTEGDSGPTVATFTVSLSSSTHSGVTFDIATQDNSATTADNDYVGKMLTGQSIPNGSSTYDFEVTVNGDTTFEPNETFFVNVTNVSGATVLDGQGIGTITNDDCPPAPADIVISQVYGGGGNSGATFTHDFIELFNQGPTTVNLSGWSVQYISATGTGTWAVTPLAGSIAPGGYYLVQQAAGAGGTTPLPTPDAVGTIAMSATAGKVALSSSTTAFVGTCPTCPIDLVGYGGANCFEGAGPTAGTSNTTAALRKRGGCFDTDNNNTDFSIGSPNPRNTASPTRSCDFIAAAIHDIQGSGLISPFLGQDVSTTGIVTGLKTNGFFLQTNDIDADPATSEGIFVFTSASPMVAVGDGLSVKGTVSEFFNLTQVESTLPGDITVNTSGNPLPAAITLTTTILDPAGSVTQLERFEGMRMHADTVVSVAPTNNFGEIFTVLDGVARPLREPGIEISLPVPPDPTTMMIDCCIPRWDENPERIMIDTDGLAGSSPISVTTSVTLSNITGPLDFTFGDYKVLPETPPTTTANISAIPVPTPAAGEFTVAGYNIENFNNNATQRQKAALAIRDVLHLPDIIGTIEIFDLADLEALAAEIQSISGVTYEARLIEADGITEDADQDVGFLVKSSVQIDSVTQEELAGCDGTAANCNTFTDPNTGLPALLNDRPPLTLRATVNPGELNPLSVIIVVNHLRSFIDIEVVGAEGARVRAKRKAQAEFLANLLQDLQSNNSGTPVMSIGDYNAYQFSDGFTDPVATIKGTPTPDDEIVVDASPDVVSPDFINLTDGLPADQRYSFIFEGTPQAIDHFIINTVAQSLVTRYHIARNNTDFPELPASLFSGNATRPEGNSDHDMPVGYFTIPKANTTTTVANATAVFSPTDQSVTLNATVSTAVGTINEGTVTFTVRNASNVVVGTPVAGPVSGGAATAMYTLPGGTSPQALTITGEFSGSDTLNSSSGTGTLSVSFGICLLYDPTKAKKSGSTYPIKIQLCDINGGNVSAASIVVHAVGVGLISDTALGEVEDAGNANPENNFRYDSGLGGTGGYIFNLKTTGLSTGTYNIYFTAGADPVQHAAQFQVK